MAVKPGYGVSMRAIQPPETAPSSLIQPAPAWAAVAATLVVGAFGVGLRLILGETLGDHGAFLVFVPAVVAGAALGGWRPGIFATVLTLAAGFLLTPFCQALAIEAVLFCGVAVTVTVGGEWFQRAHRDLSARETHLRLILNTVPDAMILIDEKGVMRAFSPTAERLFGWPVDEAVGQNVNILMPDPHREAHDTYLERYYRTGERRIIGRGRIVMGRRRDGSTFPMELAVGEMRTAEGRFFTGFVRDLTERQQAQARLQEVQEDLVRVSRLTALGEMASALAHELNQPLAAITNYLKGSKRLLQAQGMTDDRLTHAITEAAKQALRAGEIIRRLRDFVARGESERRIEDLLALVEEAGALALVGAREAGIQVEFDMDPLVGGVLVDKVQIQQVLLNLIRNAMEAMENTKSKRLAIRVSGGEDMARVSVSDTGSGIGSETAEHLFEPFRTTKRNGMGVGLSISRTIIEAHGGKIEFEALPQGGTVFHLTLQRASLAEDLLHDS